MKKVLFVAICLFTLWSCSPKQTVEAVEEQDTLVVDSVEVDTVQAEVTVE